MTRLLIAPLEPDHPVPPPPGYANTGTPKLTGTSRAGTGSEFSLSHAHPRTWHGGRCSEAVDWNNLWFGIERICPQEAPGAKPENRYLGGF